MELKKIPHSALEAALEKARHYRVLGEPNQAESICLDILAVEPGHQEARKTLILALSDQFERHLQERFRRACEELEELEDDYSRCYHEGILYERRGRAQLRRQGVRGAAGAREWLDRAMHCYEKAHALAPEKGDPVLRYNTCVRFIQQRPELRETPVELEPTMLE